MDRSTLAAYDTGAAASAGRWGRGAVLLMYLVRSSILGLKIRGAEEAIDRRRAAEKGLDSCRAGWQLQGNGVLWRATWMELYGARPQLDGLWRPWVIRWHA